MKIPKNPPIDCRIKEKKEEKEMKRKVFCPVCGEELKVKGKVSFKHCGKLHTIEDNLEKIEQPVEKLAEKVEEKHSDTPVVEPIIEEKPEPKPEPVKKKVVKKKKKNSFIDEKIKRNANESKHIPEEGWGFF